MKKNIIVVLFAMGALVYLNSCDGDQNAGAKYETYCGSCHLLPNLENIPKSVWENQVLPEMGARMGHLYNDYNPYKGSMEETYYTKLNGVYPQKPTISAKDWQLIHDYVLSHAPDTILNLPSRADRHSRLTQFEAKSLDFGPMRQFGGATNIHYDTIRNELFASGLYGIFQVGGIRPIAQRFNSPITTIIEEDTFRYITEIGIMNPSEIPLGAIYSVSPKRTKILYNELHRPVYTLPVDLNEDGTKEILVCEFGNHTGELSMLRQVEGKFQKETLVSLPGSIKVEVVDMNNDGKKDIVALFSQGKEGIYILYQDEDLTFTTDQVISFGPEYGLSWFELIDYNSDGHKDIVLVNGDNADYSIFLKPYHGIRLYLNDGSNHFEEQWFYPINGATRVMAEDFDGDDDLDFAVLSFFPDFDNNAKEGFIYLENEDSKHYKFKSYTTALAAKGNWLVMEKGDLDQDGDIDLYLGNFPMLAKSQAVKNSPITILELENKAVE